MQLSELNDISFSSGSNSEKEEKLTKAGNLKKLSSGRILMQEKLLKMGSFALCRSAKIIKRRKK